MANAPTVTVYWRLAWYARLVLNTANTLIQCGVPIFPRRFVRWVCMNHWEMRMGDAGPWHRVRLDDRGRPR
jgi:hypothetical protein